MSEFKLTVRMGNDAMQTADDVAGVLQDVADKLLGEGFPYKAQSIIDVNGNRVGQFKYDYRGRA